mmetsp:Transcript_42096/g.95093  ORF Transcript_42096/g.95093 Transcript_42096/m.95093 type:complete len:84 (+) Transcript_42096:1231-1482(+)
MRPFGPSEAVFLANEAFGSRSGWAEGSFAQAENIVHKYFGAPRPLWIDSETYENHVLYNQTRPLEEAVPGGGRWSDWRPGLSR